MIVVDTICMEYEIEQEDYFLSSIKHNLNENEQYIEIQ